MEKLNKLEKLIVKIETVDVFNEKENIDIIYKRLFVDVNDFVDEFEDYELIDELFNRDFMTIDQVRYTYYDQDIDTLEEFLGWFNNVDIYHNTIFKVDKNQLQDVTRYDLQVLQQNITSELSSMYELRHLQLEREKKEREEMEKRNAVLISDELMTGRPYNIERELQRELANQILTLNGNNYENVTNNMRQLADVIEMLEEHINDDFITLRYNQMGAWYISEEDGKGDGNDE